MSPRLDSDRIAIKPKRLSAEHYLTKDLVASAKKFDLAGQKIDLKIEPGNVVGAATALKLSPHQVRELNRQENLVEAAAAPVESDAAVRQLRQTLKKLNVGTAEDDKSVFYAINLRRRVPGELVGRDFGRLPRSVRTDLGSLLALEHKVAKREDLLLQFSVVDGKVRTVLAGRFGAFSTYLSGLTGEVDPDVEDEDDEREVEDHSADDARRDFAECYSNCMKDVPGWLIGIAGAACAACTASLAAGTIPGTQPATVPVIIASCSACAVAVGVILGNCLLTCHEMLGE